jgi:hypothetical protein
MPTIMTHPVLGEWEAGYIGTTDYRRDCAAARRAHTIASEVNLIAALLAQAEGSFVGLAAPGFALDADIRRCIGSRETYPVLPFDVRRLIRDKRRDYLARRVRRAVIDAARVRASARRAAERRTRPDAPVVQEWRYLSRYPRPLDRYAALDEWVVNRDSALHALRASMASMPNRDGRGDGDRADAGIAVNGREVRASVRWKGSSRSNILLADADYCETIDPETGYIESRTGNRPDWTCYRVHPDGTRTPLVSTATAKRRKRRTTGKSRAASVLALQSVAGTIGNVE